MPGGLGDRSKIAGLLFPQFLLRSAYPGRENRHELDRLKLNAFICCLFLSERQICAPYSLPFEFEEGGSPYQAQALRLLLRSADCHPGLYKFSTVFAASLDDFIASRAAYFEQGVRVGERELLSRVGGLPSPFQKRRSVTEEIVDALCSQRHIRYIDPRHVAAQERMLRRFADWDGEPLTVSFFTADDPADRFKGIIGSFLQDVYVASHVSDFRAADAAVEPLYNFPFLGPNLPLGRPVPPRLSDVYFPALQTLAMLAFGHRDLARLPVVHWDAGIESVHFDELRRTSSALVKTAAELATDRGVDLLAMIGALAEDLGPVDHHGHSHSPLEHAYRRCRIALRNLQRSIPREKITAGLEMTTTITDNCKRWTVLFLHALEIEEEVFLRHCVTIDPFVPKFLPLSVSRVEVRSLAGDLPNHDAYSCCVGKGNEQAAVAANSIIAKLQPDLVIFSGIAGGIKDVKIGDVVVATSVHNYQAGKEIGGVFQARPTGGRLPHSIQGLVTLARRNAFEILAPFTGAAPEARIHFGQIVSGSKVVAERAGTYETIRNTYNDALALAMEDAGVFEAMHQSGGRGAIIRGISDTLEDKNVPTEADAQERAADHAARVAIALHQSWLLNLEHV